MSRTERDIEHLAKEKAKWYWKRYAIRHTAYEHWVHADWYKHRRGPDGRFLDADRRASYRNAMLRLSPADIPSAELTVDRLEFDRFLERELLRAQPSIPDFPVLDWLAKSVFRWYWPALWPVDLDAPDWLFQIRDADRQKAFSYAECEAYARRIGVEIGPVERLFLRVVTREGVTRDVRRIIWERGSPTPPYVLEGFHNPQIIPSEELRRSLAMSNAQAKARRRLTRDELASTWPRPPRGRRRFTPSGSYRRKYLKTEGDRK